MKFPSRKVVGPLKTDEVKKAEIFLLKEVQRESFPIEVKNLKNKGTIKSTSKLKTLILL